jgi:hypothetical protein
MPYSFVSFKNFKSASKKNRWQIVGKIALCFGMAVFAIYY